MFINVCHSSKARGAGRTQAHANWPGRVASSHQAVVVAGRLFGMVCSTRLLYHHYVDLAVDCPVTANCFTLQVPAPGGWSGSGMPEQVARALEDVARGGAEGASCAEALRFPLSCSALRVEADRTGAPCVVVDCMVNTEVAAAAATYRPLKAFLVELALGWVGSKHSLTLDPRFKLPRMAYKGATPRPQRLRAERRPLVTDVTPDDDEEGPTFPLRVAPPTPATKNTRRSNVAASQASGGPTPRGASSSLSPSAAAAATGRRSVNLPAVEPSTGGCTSAAAAATLPVRGAAAAAGGGKAAAAASCWPSQVQCEGRPVAQMRVTLQLPPRPGCGAVAGGWCAAQVGVDVCGPSLRVRLNGLDNACELVLPFAADTEGACAALQSGGGALDVRLPCLPVERWAARLAEAAPVSFASLGLQGDTYMELEEPE